MICATRAWAPVNLALVKYWGKRDSILNLPATSSLSATMNSLGSIAEVSRSNKDTVDVQGDPARALRVIEAARSLSGNREAMRVQVSNTVPTAVGLASSASSMAALTMALATALGFAKLRNQVERIARLGSGSAVRSLHGGYVRWDAGLDPEGSDCLASPVFSSSHLPLAIRVAVISRARKSVPSGEAMERCRTTSPEYPGFLRDNPAAMALALSALEARDVVALGQVAEDQSMRLHSVLATADPPIDLLLPTSHAVIQAVRRLREDGVPCFFTMDAGSSVIVFTDEAFATAVEGVLARIPGVLQVLSDQVGETGATVIGGNT
jgi:diphosphomevalonate decarboxylase